MGIHQISMDNTTLKLLEAEALELERSNPNLLNPQLTDLSRAIAEQVLRQPQELDSLTSIYQNLLAQFKLGEVPFALVQGYKFAINRFKLLSINSPVLLVKNVVYFKEMHRVFPPSEAYPVGEDAPVQKLKDILFLTEGTTVSTDIVFLNDSIAEKTEPAELSENSAIAYRSQLVGFCQENNIQFILMSNNGSELPADGQLETLAEVSEIVLPQNNIRLIFTTLEQEVVNQEQYEPEARQRFEKRNEAGKLGERKGGGVVATMERQIVGRDGFEPENTVRVMADGDRAFPEAGWVGDAIYSIINDGAVAYLADLKSPLSLVVGGGAGGEKDEVTQAKFQRRKLFLSGMLIPLFFPDLRSVHNYRGTTQLPAKAFSARINFRDRKLTTVQPNVDLGLISAGLTAASQTGRMIASGPLVSIENLGSSTMTSDDTESEWSKTYGPIFTSVPSLVDDSRLLENHQWLVDFLYRMDHSMYVRLFTDINDQTIMNLFAVISTLSDGVTEEKLNIIREILTSL